MESSKQHPQAKFLTCTFDLPFTILVFAVNAPQMEGYAHYSYASKQEVFSPKERQSFPEHQLQDPRPLSMEQHSILALLLTSPQHRQANIPPSTRRAAPSRQLREMLCTR